MFEKTKDRAFQEGIAFASKTDSEKFNKQEADFAEEREEITRNMDTIKAGINQILHDAEKQQVEKIYHLQGNFDYTELEPEEKTLIINVLFTLLKELDDVNDLQKEYVISLQNYFQISNPRFDYDIASIEDNDSLTLFTNRVLYKSISEFWYLNSGDFSFTEDDDYLEICDMINLTSKKRKEILFEIQEIVEVGPEFIIAQYGFITEELLNKKSKALDSNATTSYKADTSEDEAESNNNIWEDYPNTPNKAVEKIILQKCIESTEDNPEKIINKDVYISGSLICKGCLGFINCNIIYNDFQSMGNIILEDGGTLYIGNCTITCKGENNDSFIIAKENSDIWIEHSILNNCANLIQLDKPNEILIETTQFVNNYIHCIHGTLSDTSMFQIDNCNFDINSIPLFIQNVPESDIYDSIIDVYSPDANILVNNCNIIQSGLSISLPVFHTFNAIFESCLFKNVHSCIAKALSVTNCKFENCCMAISTKENGIIQNCYFYDCKSKLKNKGFFKNDIATIKLGWYSKLEKCKFYKCSGAIISACADDQRIKSCEFINIDIPVNTPNTSILYFDGGGYRTAYIENCIFDGINIGSSESYLIGTKNPYDTKHKMVEIDNCKFYNCFTSNPNKELIQKKCLYSGLISSKYISTINIRYTNSGLDSISTIPTLVSTEKNLAMQQLWNELTVGCNLSINPDTTYQNTQKSSLPSEHTPTFPTLIMNVDEVFTLAGDLTIVIGVIQNHNIKTGDKVQINGKEATIFEIEKFTKTTNMNNIGDKVALAFKELTENSISLNDKLYLL